MVAENREQIDTTGFKPIDRRKLKKQKRKLFVVVIVKRFWTYRDYKIFKATLYIEEFFNRMKYSKGQFSWA